MPFLSNRSIVTGLTIALLTALSALAGAPAAAEGFGVPVWDILLQLNLCTGFVFLTIGVLQTMETPIPDFRSALELLIVAFVAYGVVCLSAVTPLALPASLQLFLFAFSLACIGTGWARFGMAVLRQLDEQR